MKKLAIFGAIILAIVLGTQSANAYSEITDATLTITPNEKLAKATWVTTFTIPEDMELGHMLGTISGNPIDVTGATATVTGLPAGGSVILKQRTTCASGCDDFRFYYQNPVSVSAGTQVTITINNIDNPGTANTGWNYLSLYDSAYPTKHLGANLTYKYVPLVDPYTPQPSPTPSPTPSPSPTPTRTPTSTPTFDPNCSGKGCTYQTPSPTPTKTAPQTQQQTQTTITSIIQIVTSQIFQVFYWDGSQTTDFTLIENFSSVEEFTLDVQDAGRVTWLDEIDLSTPEVEEALSNIDDYLVFDYWFFYIEWEFWAIWEAPLEVTFYDCDCVAEPAIVKDGAVLSDVDETITTDTTGTPAVAIKIDEPGEYKIQHAIKLDSETDRTSKDTYAVKGTVSDKDAVLTVAVNGEELDQSIAVNPENGEFETTVPVVDGHNVIAVTGEGETDIVPDEQTVEKGGMSLAIIILILLVIILAVTSIYFARKNKTATIATA